MHTSTRFIGLATAAVLTTAQAQKNTPFVGDYSGGSKGSVEQLMIFQDHTFCYGRVAGAMDLRVGGTWKPIAHANGKTIELLEKRQDTVAFPMWEYRADKQKPQQKKTQNQQKTLMLHGASLAYARGAVFGFSKKDLRPVFDYGQVTFQRGYAIAIPAKVRSVFVGLPNQDGSQYNMLEYRINTLPFKHIALAFDSNAISPLFKWHAYFEDGDLKLNNIVRNTSRTLSQTTDWIMPQQEADIKKTCIAPLFEKTPDKKGFVSPKRQFTLPASAIKATAWFGNNLNKNSAKSGAM